MIKYCTRCKKRVAVVFVQKIDGTGKSETEAYCLKCARELGINTDQINEMMGRMGLDEEQFDRLSEEMTGFPEDFDEDAPDENEDEDEDESDSRAPSLDFGAIFGGKREKTDEKKQKKEKVDKKRKNLEAFCINLTRRAAEGKLDPVIGRERELERVLQILSRRQKNNPCLIGEPGVGKTAVAEALAQRIADGKVPHRLKKCEVYLVDMTLIVAGTQFRGQFENRMKGLIEEVKALGNIILVIDEIHSIVSAGDAEGGMNAANILKPALSRGEIQVIGATTLAEYRKYIEKDAALERRFQPIVIKEPSIGDSIEILRGIKENYEKFHGVLIPDETVRKTVLYSERYITDRYLPDKAIDLLDEAAAYVALRNRDLQDKAEAEEELSKTKTDREALENAEASEEDVERFQKIADLKVKEIQLSDRFTALCEKCKNITVTPEDLAQVIEIWTGIPAGNISENEFARIDNLAARLKDRIVGQDAAVDAVAKAIKRSRAGISAKRKPVSFIFAGPTGVGKTELVKTLSADLFDSPEALIRLDMSEFMEKHAVSRIIGAPPGYVGYDEAGQLTEKIRRRPYSVILFDELEKAHPDVLNILLQILDDGRITDAQGRVVNFENTIIIMTSNAGSNQKGGSVGFGRSLTEQSKEKAMKALGEFLRPEFINRVDEIVCFNQLSEENFRGIADIMLAELKQSLEGRGIAFTWDESVKDYLVKKSYSVAYGARNLRRAIQTDLEDPIAERIIKSYVDPFRSIKATCEDGTIRLETV